MLRRDLVRDESAAATELGYVFTFAIGLLFLSAFSIWVWDIEVATKERWTDDAMEENLMEVAAAIERADEAHRLDANATYAEPVPLLLSSASALNLQFILTDDALLITDGGAQRQQTMPISGAASTTHGGTVKISGLDTIWVVLNDGAVSIQSQQPGF